MWLPQAQQLTTTYQANVNTKLKLRYNDLDDIIKQEANRGAPQNCQEYLKCIQLFLFDETAGLIERLGTSKYLMAQTESRIQQARRWTKSVNFRRHESSDEL